MGPWNFLSFHMHFQVNFLFLSTCTFRFKSGCLFMCFFTYLISTFLQGSNIFIILLESLYDRCWWSFSSKAGFKVITWISRWIRATIFCGRSSSGISKANGSWGFTKMMVENWKASSAEAISDGEKICSVMVMTCIVKLLNPFRRWPRGLIVV